MCRMRLHIPIAAASVLMLGVGAAGCADSSIATTPYAVSPVAANADAAKFWEAGASIYWNELLRNLIAGKTTKPNQQATLRAFTYLSLAQYDAVVAAEDGKDRGVHPST